MRRGKGFACCNIDGAFPCDVMVAALVERLTRPETLEDPMVGLFRDQPEMVDEVLTAIARERQLHRWDQPQAEEALPTHH